MPKQLSIVMIPVGDRHVQLNVNGNVYATYQLFSGSTPEEIMLKAALEVRDTLYAYSSGEPQQYSETFV